MRTHLDSAQSQHGQHLEAAQATGYQRTKDAVSREIGGETVVVPICHGVGDLDSVFTFNEVGGALWRCLEQQQTAEQLSAWITERFKVSQEQAVADVQEFLKDLLEAGLVQVRAA